MHKTKTRHQLERAHEYAASTARPAAHMGTGTKTKHYGHQEELLRKYSCKFKTNFDLIFLPE